MRLRWFLPLVLIGCSQVLGIGDDDTDEPGSRSGSSGDAGSSGTTSSSGSTASGSSGATSSSGGSSSSSAAGGPSSSSGAASSSSGGPQILAWSKLAAGVQNGCGILNTGELACWGLAPAHGQPELSTSITLPRYVRDAGGQRLTHVVDVAVGNQGACAMISDPNQVVCWGSGANGRLGNNGATSSDTPVQVVDADGAVITDWLASPTSLELGAQHACGLRSGGRIACWGSNTYGELGIGNDDGFRAHAVEVMGDGVFTGATALALGENTSCALTEAKKVYCWGDRFKGKLGDGVSSGSRMFPDVVLTANGDLTDVTQISQSYSHTCAIAGGQAYCWGSNDQGILGRGSATPSSSAVAQPVLLGGEPLSAVSVAAGRQHTCAAGTTGEAWCWGRQDGGRLGLGVEDGETVFVPTPVVTPDGALGGVRQVAISWYHSYALGADGVGSSWGDRALGHDSELSPNHAVPIELTDLREAAP